METLKKIATTIGNVSNTTWSFLSGKKRWISLGLLTLSHVTPKYTAVGQAINFLTGDGYDYVTTGLEVLGGLFATGAVADHVVSKVQAAKALPSGIEVNTNQLDQK